MSYNELRAAYVKENLKDEATRIIKNDPNLFITAFNEEIEGQTDEMRRYVLEHYKSGLYSPEYATVGRLFCEYMVNHVIPEVELTLEEGFKG
jgi:hypothetical protein